MNRLECCHCCCRCHRRPGIVGLVLLLGGFVTVELPLNPAESTAPERTRFLLDVVQFILIQFQLGLGQVDLLLQAGPGAIARRVGDLFLQLVNPLLIGFDRRSLLAWA